MGGVPSVGGLSKGSQPIYGFVCEIKAKCPHVGPVPAWGVLSVGVFIRDPNPNLIVFRGKPRKNPNG